MNTTALHKRINISLPREVIELLDRISAHGERSGFIAEAVRSYAKDKSKAAFRKRLAEGYVKRAARDLAMAKEWEPLEDEVWRKYP